IPAGLLMKAMRDGRARIIVALDQPFTPEGKLGGRGAVAAQRSGLARAREALLGRLPRGSYALSRSYETIPFVALDATPEALRARHGGTGGRGRIGEHLFRPRPGGARALCAGLLARPRFGLRGVGRGSLRPTVRPRPGERARVGPLGAGQVREPRREHEPGR